MIYNWEKSGLKLPSVIRVHKMATLEKELVELLIGRIDIPIKKKVTAIISKLTD